MNRQLQKRKASVRFYCSLIAIVLMLGNLFAQQPTLIWLGTLGGDQSEARAVSADGSAVVGTSYNLDGLRAFRWTAATGMQDLGTLGGNWSEATDVSADGSVVVGWSYDNNSIFRAFKWTAATGMQDLGTGDYSKAVAVSADGSVIVINKDNSAYRWTSSSGLEDLGTLGGISSTANDISADGSYICGTSYVSAGDPYAFRWIQGVGMEQIGTFYSFGVGISGDGNTITGFETGSMGIHLAFKWTQSGGFVFNIAGNFSEGYAVSGDGNIIIGYYGDGAFHFSEAGGLQALNQVYSSLLNGSSLSTALGISPNGFFIVGQGTNAATSRIEGFLLAAYGTNLITTTLTAEAVAGSQTLEVTSINGFNIGDNLKINPGGVNEETNTITGFGSILLQNPLQFDHSIGEIVLNLTPTSVEENNSNVPSDYALYNNYPNPFNPSTKIKYQIPEISFVTIKVFDVLGKEIETLVNEEKPAGPYEVDFNVAQVSRPEIASGVYFYQLKAGLFVEIKKMILLK